MSEISDIYKQIESSGLKKIHDKYAYEYDMNSSNMMNTDPFVEKVMKQFSPYIYEACSGYTKQIDTRVGLATILKFVPHNHQKSNNNKFLQ